MPSSLLEINAVSDIQFDQAKISAKSEAGGAQGIVLAFPGCPSNCTEVVLSLEDFRGAGSKNSGREAPNETLPAVGGHEGLGQVRARTSPVKSEPAIYSKKRTVPQTSQTTVYIGLVDEMVAATKHKIPEKRARAQPLLTEYSKRYSHKTAKRTLIKNITKPTSEKANNEKAAGTNTRTDKRSELRIQPGEAATQPKWPRKPFSFQKTSPLSLSSGARQRNKPSEKRRENTLLICPVQRTSSAGGSCKQKTLELQNGDKPGIRIHHGRMNSSMDPRFGKHPEHVRIWRRSAEGDTRPKKRHEKVSNAGTCPDRKTKNTYDSLIGEANTENKQEEGHAVISSGPSSGSHLLRANAPRSPLRLKLKGHRTIDKMFVDVMKILLTSGDCQEFTPVDGQEKNSDVCDSSRLTEPSKKRDDAAESTTNASSILSSQSGFVNSSRAQDFYKVHELMTYSAHDDDDDDDDDGDGDVFVPCFCSTLTYHNADPDSNNCHYRCGHDQDGRGTAWTSQRTASLSDDPPRDSLNSNENSDSPADGVPETKEHESKGPGAGGAGRSPSNTDPAISGPSTSKGQPEGRPPKHQQKISRAKYPVASDLHLSHFTASSPLEGLFEPINSGREEEKCHGSSCFCPAGCSDNWAALGERSPRKGQTQERAKDSTADIDCRARGSWDNIRTESIEECERTDKDKEEFGSVSGGGSCKALKEHALEALANSEQYRLISKPAGNAGPDWINSLSLQEKEGLKTTDLSSDTDKVLLLERSYGAINIAHCLGAVPTLEKKEGQVLEACQGIHDKVPLLFPGVSSQARKGCIAAAASCLGKARSVMSKARSRSLSPVSFVARIKNFFVSDSKTEAAANKSQSTPGVTSGFDTPSQASFDVSREADSGRKDEKTVEGEDASKWFQSISDQSSQILDDLPETGQKNVGDHASASQLTTGKSLQHKDQTTEREGSLSPRECSETELDFKAALTGRHGPEELQLATPTLTRLRSPFLESIAETDSISEESRSAEGDVEGRKENGLENNAGRDDFLEAFVASCCRKGAASNMAGSVDDGDHVGDCKMAAQISSSFTDFKRDPDDVLSVQDDTSVSAPMKTHSLVNAGEVTQTESSVVEVMAIISQEVNIKRYPSFIDLTDLNDEGVFRVSKPSEQDPPVHNAGHEKSGQQNVHQHSSSPHQEVFKNSSLCDEISARRRRDSRSTQDWPVESPRKLNINSDFAEHFPGVSFHIEKSKSGVSDDKARSLSPDSWLSLTSRCTEENFFREASVPNQNTILGKLRENPPITFQQKITYRPHLFRGVFDIPSHVDRERKFNETASDDFQLPSLRNDSLSQDVGRSYIDEFPVDANSRYAHSEQRAPDVAGSSQVTATLKPSAELCQGKLVLLRAASTGNSSPGSGMSPGSGVVNDISDTSLNQELQTSENHRSKAGASSNPQTTEERATCTAHPQNFSGKRRLTQASSVSYEEDDSLFKDAAAHAAMEIVGKCVFSQNISPGTSQDDPVELMQKNKNNFDDGCKMASTAILPRASSPSEVPGSSGDFSKDTAGEDFEEAPPRNMEQDATPPCQGHLEAEASGMLCEMQANGASRSQTADNVTGDENSNSDSLREYPSREALKRDTLGCSTDTRDSSTGKIPGCTTSDNCNSCLSKTESEYSVPDNSEPDSDKHRLIQNEACTTHSAKSSRRDSLSRNDKDNSGKNKDSRMAAATNLTFLDKIFKSNKPKSFKFNTSAKKTCSCYSPCRRESRRGRTSSCHHFKRDISAGSERGDETVVNPKALKVGSHLTITSVSTVFGAPDKNSSQSRRSVKRFVSTSAVCKHGVTADPAAKGSDVDNPGVFGVSGRRGASLQSLSRGLSNKPKASFSQSTSSTGTNEVTDESDFPVILGVAGSHHSSTDARHVFGSDLKVMQVEESSMDALRERHELASATSLSELWADPAAESSGLSQQEAANQNLASRLTWKLRSPSHEAKKSYDFASRSKPHLERCDQLIKRSAEIIRVSREMIDSSQRQLESTAEKLSLTKPVRESLPSHNNITTD